MAGEANPGSSLSLAWHMLLNIASIVNYAQKLDAVVRPPKHQKVTRPPHNPKLRPRAIAAIAEVKGQHIVTQLWSLPTPGTFENFGDIANRLRHQHVVARGRCRAKFVLTPAHHRKNVAACRRSDPNFVPRAVTRAHACPRPRLAPRA